MIRLGVKKGKLQSEAVAKLQGELEKEGRAASSSVAMPQKAAAGAGTRSALLGKVCNLFTSSILYSASLRALSSLRWIVSQ